MVRIASTPDAKKGNFCAIFRMMLCFRSQIEPLKGKAEPASCRQSIPASRRKRRKLFVFFAGIGEKIEGFYKISDPVFGNVQQSGGFTFVSVGMVEGLKKEFSFKLSYFFIEGAG